MIINSVLFSLYFFFDSLFFFLFIYSCKMAYIFPKVINVSNKQVVLLSAKAGFAIGCYFEGVGAVPGTIIGGAIGGIPGAYHATLQIGRLICIGSKNKVYIIMTFRRETEKALKGYLYPLGFKYYAKDYSYIRAVNDDVKHCIGFAEATCSRARYFYLRTFVTVISNSLNEIIYEVTGGNVDLRNTKVSPAYINVLEDEYLMQVEFIGDRPMEENIAEFDKLYKEKVKQVFDMFNTQKSIYTCPIRLKFYNVLNVTDLWYYVPFAYYLNREFEKAFSYIEERLKIEEEKQKRILEKYDELTEDDTEGLRAYTSYYENIKKWVEEKRTFKVDEEYLPRF